MPQAGHTKSLRITVGNAALTRLMLTECKDFQFACTSPEKLFQKLEVLMLRDCSEVGKLLIEDVGQMSHLPFGWSASIKVKDLREGRSPFACMFPQGNSGLLGTIG